MRILHLVHRYYPAVGGTERMIGRISEALTTAGHSVTVATSSAIDFDSVWRRAGQQVNEPHQVHNGVDIRYFAARYLPFARWSYPAVRLLGGGLGRFRVTRPLAYKMARLTPWLPALADWLKSNAGCGQFDVVAAMGVTFEGVIATGVSFAQRENIPIIIYPLLHLGADSKPGTDPLSRFYTLPHQLGLISEADAVIATSQTEADFLIKAGIAGDKITAVGPGIDPHEVRGGDGERLRQRLGLKTQTPIILPLGSQTADKGFVDIIHALTQVWSSNQAAHLIFAGAPSPLVERQIEAVPTPFRQNLTQMGQVDDPTRRDLLAAADIFCLPSRTESFGIVYLEAWLYRKPVVAARTWGVAGDVVVDGQDGLIVPFGDPEQLAQALLTLLDDSSLREKLGLAGYKKTMSNHTWAVKMPRITAVYEHFASRGSR